MRTETTTRRSTLLRRVRRGSGLVLTLAALWFLLPVAYGGHLGLTVVAGHSMEPTYWTDDLVLTWKGSSYDPGEAVVYTVPDGQPGEGLDVVHRVDAINDDGTFRMLGDNNPSPDPWTPTATDVQGKVFLHVPKGGLVLRTVMSPLALAFLCGLLAFSAVLTRPTPVEPAPVSGRTGGRARTGLVAAVVAAIVAAWVGPPASAATLGGVRPGTIFSVKQAANVPAVPLTDAIVSGVVTSATATQFCVTGTVTSLSLTYIKWRVTVDHNSLGMSDSSYWLAAAPTSYDGATQLSFAAATGAWTITGDGTNDYIKLGESATFHYCAPTGAAAPLTDAISSASVTSSGLGWYCATVTVSTLSTTWIRWRSTIDGLTGGLLGQPALSVQPPTYAGITPISFNATLKQWKVEGVTANRLVRLGSPVTWTYCTK